MIQDIYLTLVRCENCKKEFPMVYKFNPELKEVHPFADACNCDDSCLTLVSDTAPTPEQWFEYMEMRSCK